MRRLAASLVSAAVLLTGCATGDDAVAQGGTFEFVAPGGKTDIFYDPPASRSRPGRISGSELTDPSKTISVGGDGGASGATGGDGGASGATGDDGGASGATGDDGDFVGKVVVVNVWGQWCGPCRSEIPELQKVYDATRGLGVAFLGIDVRDNNRDAAVDFVTDRKVTYPSIYDPAMRTMIAFGGRYPTTVVPSTIVLDRQHRVAAVFLRELLAQDLQPLVERLAAEK